MAGGADGTARLLQPRQGGVLHPFILWARGSGIGSGAVTAERTFTACDVCGAESPEPLLASPRLDGPLVRCRRCGLVYVGRRGRDFTFTHADPAKSDALARRVDALELVDVAVEEAEAPWRHQALLARLRAIRRHVDGGRLLDLGCAAGDFLSVAAGGGFEVVGVEPHPVTSAWARENRGLDVRTGTLADTDLPAASFDVVTLFHVVEHLDSPRATLAEVARLLRAGGVVAVETPTVDGLWFRLLRGRWRQLIPDHYFFFSASTLGRLLEETGFEALEVRSVARTASLRFLADRVRRVDARAGRAAVSAVRTLGLGDRALYVTPGDIMLCLARRPA